MAPPIPPDTLISSNSINPIPSKSACYPKKSAPICGQKKPPTLPLAPENP